MNQNMRDTIRLFAELDLDTYNQVRTSCAAGLGIEPDVLDEEIEKLRNKISKENPAPYKSVLPWHEAVSPSVLLDEIAITIKRFIVCPDETVTAATLWIAMTWFIDDIHIAPLAVITAPDFIGMLNNYRYTYACGD